MGVLLDVVRTQDVLAELGATERALGDYPEWRYAWRLAAVRPVTPPVPCAGRQRLWTLDAPTAAVVRARSAPGEGPAREA